MKIENLQLLDFDDISKFKYDVKNFRYRNEYPYMGYVDEESAKVGFTDSAAFTITNLVIKKNKLYGDFNLINAPASELLSWINDFHIGLITYGDIDEETNEILTTELVSFVAYPV